MKQKNEQKFYVAVVAVGPVALDYNYAGSNKLAFDEVMAFLEAVVADAVENTLTITILCTEY